MKVFRFALALSGAALLAACGSPAQSIEKDCVRLDMMSEMGAAADLKKNCSCFAGKLKESMSDKKLKAFAKSLKASKSESDFEAEAKKNGIDESDSMSMMGAAKSCATGQ